MTLEQVLISIVLYPLMFGVFGLIRTLLHNNPQIGNDNG